MGKKREHIGADDEINLTPCVDPVMTEPSSPVELINKYGTYNIQPTADTDNTFPVIAQGLPEDGLDAQLKGVPVKVRKRRTDKSRRS